jgi:hypothetical protein
MKPTSMQTRVGLLLVLLLECTLGSAIQAQGTIYASNTARTPTGSASVSQDSWLAQVFYTGSNPDGYRLNSLSLLMDPASGNPAGFSLSIYSSSSLTPVLILGSLTGPDPVAGGLSVFTSNGILLSPSSYYFAVATANTVSSQGAYNWSITAGVPLDSEWDIRSIGHLSSTDGMDWLHMNRTEVFQLEIGATAVPEPSRVWLGLLGLGLLAVSKRNRHSLNPSI